MLLNRPTRRGFLVGSLAVALPFRAFALSVRSAERYVQDIINNFLETINANTSDEAILRRFSAVFASYADFTTISRLVLGPPWRTISANQKVMFERAFTSYLTEKYAQRFRAYRGASITISRAVDAGRKGVLVYSSVKRVGDAPFDLDWQVSDGSGQVKLIDMIIEGIPLISSEREEIRARLASNRGNVDALSADLLR